jgi:hypothetical protein
MAHFADLDTTTQIASGPHIRAIGWLSAQHSYPRGVEKHEYLPPQEFIHAVLTTSTPGSAEYAEAVIPFVARPAC